MRDLEKLLSENIDRLMPGISTSSVVFGFQDGKIHVLVSKLKEMNLWMIPTGYVFHNEDVNSAAARVLEERIGSPKIYIDQFYTFGQKNRATSKEENFVLFSRFIENQRLQNWFNQRFVSVGFLVLVRISECELKLNTFSDEVKWVPVDKLPHLIFDNKDLVDFALNYMRLRASHLPIARYLLENQFTMKDLQTLYEELFQKRADRGNFQKRILKLNILNRHEKQMNGNAHRAPYLYSINIERYELHKKNNQDIMS